MPGYLLDPTRARPRPRLLLLAQVASVLGLALGLHRRGFPLGVRGEWEWFRLAQRADAIDLVLAALGLTAYATAVTLVAHRLVRGGATSRPTVAPWLVALTVGGVLVQLALMWGAPLGYGVTRWVTLALPGSSGYFEVAREEVVDPHQFLLRYPEWIRRQDALHIGTHPPGLVLWAHAARRLMADHPSLTRSVLRLEPESVRLGFRTMVGAMPPADRAAMVATGGLTLLLCVSALIPLYGLARAFLGPSESWTAASLWPLVPATILFHPTADTAFALPATLALALAAWAGKAAGWKAMGLGLSSGFVLAVGMQFTLAFVAVGLVSAFLLAGTSGSLRAWIERLVAIGTGFLAVTFAVWALTGANPFLTWWWNQANHARFYVEYPRTYWKWILVNPLELAVALGLPTCLATLCALRLSPRGRWPVLATLAVLALLTLSGRNLSEIARLWIPLMPPLLVGAGAVVGRTGRGGSLAATIVLSGLQVLVLENALQVVYPVAG